MCHAKSAEGKPESQSLKYRNGIELTTMERPKAGYRTRSLTE